MISKPQRYDFYLNWGPNVISHSYKISVRSLIVFGNPSYIEYPEQPGDIICVNDKKLTEF